MDEHAPQKADALGDWQHKLLPLMSRMLIGLTLFFLLASFVQLAILHYRIQQAPMLQPSELTVPPTAGADPIAVSRMTIEARLEANLIARRYHQANVAMMSRVWVHYLGFVTGMILSLMGSAFILGQISIAPTELESKAPVAPGTLRTASPGIVLCVLGAALMITTIVVHHDIEAIDKPTYFKADPKPQTDAVPDSLPDTAPPPSAQGPSP